LFELLIRLFSDQSLKKFFSDGWTKRGNGFTSNSLSHLMMKLYGSAGFDGASSHSGRRSFATNILCSGVDIVALKTLMNHSNISTTAEYVSHNESYLKRAVLGV
jgi:integrase/recombinase XerD